MTMTTRAEDLAHTGPHRRTVLMILAVLAVLATIAVVAAQLLLDSRGTNPSQVLAPRPSSVTAGVIAAPGSSIGCGSTDVVHFC